MKKYFLFAITTAIVVFFLVLVNGCTLSTANNTAKQTSMPLTAVSRDAFLEKHVNQLHDVTQRYSNLQAWDENWLNSTTVSLVYTYENKISHTVFNEDMAIMHFNSTDDAVAYFNSLNMTGYKLFQNIYPSAGPYQVITGHAPVPYKYYVNETDAKHKSYRTLMEDIVAVGESTGF